MSPLKQWARDRRTTAADDLRSVPLFADCTGRELSQVRSLTTAVTVPAGSVLLTEGAARHQFVVVADGSLSISRDDQPIAVLGAGDFVGEISLLRRTRPNATVTTLTPTTMWVSTAGEFAALMEAAPSAAEKVTATAAERLATAS